VTLKQGPVLLAPVVVLATPAYASAPLVQNFDPLLARKLASIYYPPLATVALAYPQATINHPLEGWGHLIPRDQGLNSLGAIWSSSLFPERAPAGWHLITCLMGGAMDPQIKELDEEEMIRLAHSDLQKIFGLRQDPKVIAYYRRDQAIPQYCLGHMAKVTQIKALLKARPGLFLCANYLAGLSLSEMVHQATQLAQPVRQYWLSQQTVSQYR
jgi:oxygen-dependent protoporphyrinogen oxidase